MIKEWVDYRLHLNALFSELSVPRQRALLALLQDAESRFEGQVETVTEPKAPLPVKGVSWDKAKGKWRVTLPVDGKKRGYGRFGTRSEAEARVKEIKAFAEERGHMPPAGGQVRNDPV